MDTQIQESNEPNEVSLDRPSSVGVTLRTAREQQGLSIDDVYGRIKFAPRQIKALEADDFAAIPEGAFLRGFVRSYARMLQLDEKVLIAGLPCATPVVESVVVASTVDVPLPSEYDERKATLLKSAAIGAAVLVLLGIGAWSLFGSPSGESAHVDEALSAVSAPVAVSAPLIDSASAPESAPVQAEVVASTEAIAQAVPVPAPVAQSAAVAVATEAPLRLVFVEGSWAEVRDKRGAMLISQRNPAGSELSFEGEAPFYVAIARVGGVKVYFKGKLVDLTTNTVNGSARMKLE